MMELLGGRLLMGVKIPGQDKRGVSELLGVLWKRELISSVGFRRKKEKSSPDFLYIWETWGEMLRGLNF